MEEIMANDFLNNSVMMNILFLVAFQAIISIISYRVLERYSWKETFLANLVITFGVAIIKLHGMSFFRILITAIVQTITMVGIEIYMYDKYDEMKDFFLRTTSLNLMAFGRRSYGMYSLGSV